MVRKEKKFQPIKKPRMLLNNRNNYNVYSDLEEYNKHRYRVFTATTKVDDKPCSFSISSYLKARKVYDDAVRQQEIDMQNKALLKKIIFINRQGGLVDCFNYTACLYNSRLDELNSAYQRITKFNNELYSQIKNAKSRYDRETMREFWKRCFNQIKHNCKYKVVIFKKKSEDDKLASMPSISQNIDIQSPSLSSKLYSYLEFSVKNGQKIGRVYIRLYYDIVPVTVQNFYEICSGLNKFGYTYKNSAVHRIKRGNYLEAGDIVHGTGRGGVSIYGAKFREEKHYLKHSKPGVLSMIRVGKRENDSKFCITFAPMELLDRRNVVFGSIYKGMDVLLALEGYSRKIGKPIADIIISDCNIIE